MASNKTSEEKKRVFILGSSPLPIENAAKNFAPGARTWHFACSARDANCNVMVIGYRIPKSYQEDLPEIKFQNIQDIDYYSVGGEIFENKEWLREKITKFNPDSIIGVTTYPASVAAALNLEIPFWADLFGSVMAEAQAKANIHNNDFFLQHYFNMEKKVLDKADVFSTVSEAQGFSLVGELGIWGRLNKDTMGYRFVRVIPTPAENKDFKHTKNVIRGVFAKDSDFVILYSGGYNTWTDVNTLFQGLEKAMNKNPKLIFVSTGGQIDGHDEITYKHFEELIDSSRFKDRFHLCGWVPHEDLPNYYLEADLGINSDKYCYEALLGSRTRVLDWLRVPLTFISTPLSEVTDYLIKNNLAIGFKQGDSDDLAEKLLRISSNPQELEKVKENLKKILTEEFTTQQTYSEFKEWIKNPKHAPDHGRIKGLISKNNNESPSNIKKSGSKIERLALSAWPKISSLMMFFRLGKYSERVKMFGFNLIVREKPVVYHAKFLQVELPEMQENSKYIIPITVKNIGKKTWQSHKETEKAVNLSYIWKDTSGNTILKPEERTPLPKSIKKGKKINLDAMITSPPKAGEYNLEIDLIKEGEFWFSEKNSQPYIASINVKKKIKTEASNMPKVSIVVVSYNSEQYIIKCIDSLLKSKYPNFEIIVVDNSSKDNSLQKLREFKNNIKLIESKKNLGFSGGNNLGIQNSQGEITVLINPDVYVTEDSILELILPLLNDHKIMITGSKILYPNSKKIQSAGGLFNKNGLTSHIGYGEQDNHKYNYLKSVDYVTGAAMAIRKKLFDITGLFDTIYFPAYYEEAEKCFIARKLGYKVVYSPKSTVYHFESITHGVGSKSYLRMFHTNRFKFIYKNFDLRSYLFKFIPFELGWFFVYCPPSARGLVIKSHLRAIFSPGVIFKKNYRTRSPSIDKTIN